MLAFLPYLISLERKSICLHTCYQVTYSLFHFLLVSFFQLRGGVTQNSNSEKRSFQLTTFKMFWVLRVFWDRIGENQGEPRNMQKTVRKGKEYYEEEKKFLMVKAIMVFFSLLFPYSRRGNVSSSKSTLIVIFFLVMSQLLHTFFPL